VSTPSDYAKLVFKMAYRRLRKVLKDPCELAWRLDPGANFCKPHANVMPYVRAAHTAMYERELYKAYLAKGWYTEHLTHNRPGKGPCRCSDGEP
jgi:hypothetical protein